MSTLAWQLGFTGFAAGLIALPWLRFRRALKGSIFKGASPRDCASSRDWLASATEFRSRIDKDFDRLLDVARVSGAVRGANEDGVPFLVLGPKDHLSQHLPPSARRLRLLVIAARSIDIPARLVCERNIYADSRASVSPGAVIRGVFARQEATIGVRARVTRWVRSEQRVEASDGAVLYGCASAGQELMLARHVRFERLHAPVIFFGKPDSRYDDFGLQRLPFAPPREVRVTANRRWVVDGNMELPPGRQIDADLVVAGHLILRADSFVRGDVRVGKGILLEARAAVSGAVISERDIVLKEDCRIHGPVIAQKRLHGARGVHIGVEQHPTTVVAKHIQFEESCVVYGAVWARRSGKVLAGKRIKNP